MCQTLSQELGPSSEQDKEQALLSRCTCQWGKWVVSRVNAVDIQWVMHDDEQSGGKNISECIPIRRVKGLLDRSIKKAGFSHQPDEQLPARLRVSHPGRFSECWCPGCKPDQLSQTVWGWDPSISSFETFPNDPQIYPKTGTTKINSCVTLGNYFNQFLQE